MAMDLMYSLQDVIRCDHCETPVPPKHCDICHIHLCEACVGEHLSDKLKDHYIVPFKMRGIICTCQKHSTKLCKELCKTCNIPVCTLCVSTNEHDQHEKEDILKVMEEKTELMKGDLQDLKRFILPKYQEAASCIPGQRADAIRHYQKITASLNKQGENLHREIDIIIQKMQTEIKDMDIKHLAAIDKQENAINQTITEITKIIQKTKDLLDSSDVCLVSKYTSMNTYLRCLPAQFEVILPTFTSHEINKEQICQHVGSISELTITYNLIDEPRILTEINTEYEEGSNRLMCVSCLSDNEFWTSGEDKMMRLYNLQGKLLKSVQSKSGKEQWYLAVTLGGDLVYTDYWDRSINLVSKTQIKSLIRVHEWKPMREHCTTIGELLVTMRSDDNKQTKVVRYSGSTEKQCIQWDEQGKPLYSSGYFKYLSENRNLDVCVADCDAHAVVVVSAAGQLRFRYTGPPTTNKKSFDPRGITTDINGRILTADYSNDRIHIVDQDGHFLRYIDNIALHGPWDLCMDYSNNLFVAEYITGIVKKIQCYK